MLHAVKVLRRQNKYIEIFLSAGAVDKQHAATLNKLKIERDTIFDKMLSLGILEQCGNGLFYLDTEKAESLKENRSGFRLWRVYR